MDSTPLHHKLVDYGDAGNTVFGLLIVLHIIPSVIAPIAGVVGMLATKGKKWHVRAGRFFLWAMIGAAVSGVLLNTMRLLLRVAENHQKLPGFAMPSSYPARLAFVFAGLCVPYLGYEATQARTFRSRPLEASKLSMIVPGSLVVIGIGLIALVFMRFNPWTGALWMIATFVAGVAVTASLRRRQVTDGSAGVARHRFAMLFLFAFSLWGALQGFGPAIAVALRGVDDAQTRYVGNLPGPFKPVFFFFLIGWAPAFVLSAFLLRRFASRRAARAAVPND